MTTIEPNTGRRREDGEDTTEPNTGRRREDGDDSTDPSDEPDEPTVAHGEDPGFGSGEQPTEPVNATLAVGDDGEDPGFGSGGLVESESAPLAIGEEGDDPGDVDRAVLDDAPELGEFTLDDAPEFSDFALDEATLEPQSDTADAVDSFEDSNQSDGNLDLVVEDAATPELIDDGLIEE